jgi:hypothetical protein
VATGAAQPAHAQADEIAQGYEGQNTKISPSPDESALGKVLRRIRERYIAEGGRLLSMEEIDREVAQRRGERST